MNYLHFHDIEGTYPSFFMGSCKQKCVFLIAGGQSLRYQNVQPQKNTDVVM